MPPPLTPDEMLATTRAVRRRLDLARPVERELVEQCLRLALQAPSASNTQRWHFVVVTDPAVRAALADCYRTGWAAYANSQPWDDGSDDSPLQASSRHLARHLHEVPVHVVPCIAGRPEGRSAEGLAALYGSVVQAGWSLQLAARARGLGSVWTTLHLARERDAADALGIPYDTVAQVALIPLAHTLGDEFRPARRRPLDEVVHWERW